MKPRPPSLTTRLALLFALSSTALVLALGAATYVLSERHFVEQDAHDLHARAQIIGNLIARTEPKGLPDALDAVLASHHELAVALLDADGRPIYTRAPEVFAAARTATHSHPAGAEHHDNADHAAALATLSLAGRSWRSYALEYAGAGPTRQIWLAIDIDHHLAFLTSLLRWLVFGAAAAALLSGGLGVWVARRGLAPLKRISADATLISAQRLSRRLDSSHLPRELLPLVSELNAMLARLDDAFRRLTDFSSDIAHELRTPISNLVTETEVALTRARSADEYRDVLASNLEEFGRLSRMVADMLFLARADHGLVVPQRIDVDLAAEGDALLSFYDALAEERGVTLERTGEAHVSGDPLMLRRALANLLSNAIRHAAPASTISVHLAPAGQGAEIAVCNAGDTIPPEHLPRVFDRFYRGDFARHRDADGTNGANRANEGTGLGLGIVKSIVEAHGGAISVDSRDGRTCFRITLP